MPWIGAKSTTGIDDILLQIFYRAGNFPDMGRPGSFDQPEVQKLLFPSASAKAS